MNDEGKASQIRCPIGLFQKQEREAVRLNAEMNRAPTVAEKRRPAQAFIETVDVLLACAHYDENDANCRLCHGFSELRRKVATLIVDVGRM